MTMIEGYEGGFIPQGWQCPICKRVYAPDWPWCTVCGQGVTVTTTTELPTNTFMEDAYKFVHDYMTGKKREGASNGDSGE